MNTAPNDQPMDAWRAIIKNVQVIDRSELSNLPESVSYTHLTLPTNREV